MTPPAPLQLPTADEALAWIRDRTATGLATARELVAGLREDPPTEPEGVLRRWDEVTLALQQRRGDRRALLQRPPDLEVRTASEEAEIEVDKLVTELRQDRALFDVFAALDPGGLDPTGLDPTAAGEDARGVPARGRRPGRRDPRAAGRDQRADHRDRPGVQPQHP